MQIVSMLKFNIFSQTIARSLKSEQNGPRCHYVDKYSEILAWEKSG